MARTRDLKQEYSDRLNEALDEAGYPPKGEGRQVRLAKAMGVSQKGARKWLEAEAIPSMENNILLAVHLDVQSEWLLSGRGEKRIPEPVQQFSPEVVRFAKRMECLPPERREAVFPAVEILTAPVPDSRAA